MRNDRLMQRADSLAETFLAKGWIRPGELPSEAQVEAYYNNIMASRGVKPHDEGPLIAFVNDSRWVGGCDYDHPIVGIPLTPGQIAATCPMCGARYDVIWPDVSIQERIEATLLERPARLPKAVDAPRIVATRCWTPDQSVEMLEAETATLKAVMTETAVKGVN